MGGKAMQATIQANQIFPSNGIGHTRFIIHTPIPDSTNVRYYSTCGRDFWGRPWLINGAWLNLDERILISRLLCYSISQTTTHVVL